MPLVRTDLERRIREAMDSITEESPEAPPANALVPSRQVVSKLSGAYDSWVKSGFPVPPLTFVTPPQKSVLEASLAVPTLLPGWATGMFSYWTPTTITGPGLIPVNPLDPTNSPQVVAAGTRALTDLTAMLATKEPDIDASVQKLASILFTFTTSLVFLTTTTSVPPVVAKIPVK